MLFKRAREAVSGFCHSLLQGTIRDLTRWDKVIKAVDDNNIDDLRNVISKLSQKDMEDYIRRPMDSMKRTLLHFAAWAENPEILEVLLEYVTEADVEDRTGVTPIMFAVRSNHNYLKKIHMLINKNVDINKKDKSGVTLLHVAVQLKRRDILELLLNNGADRHIIDGENRSLLHIACDNGDIAFVKYLVENGVSLRAIDKNGWTPLHIACGPGDDYELVHYLIENGANPYARDLNQYTPLDLATHFKARKIEEYLKELEDSETDDETDDLSLTNDTYESDNVFESEPTSYRGSQKSNVSFRMVDISLNKKPIVKY